MPISILNLQVIKTQMAFTREQCKSKLLLTNIVESKICFDFSPKWEMSSITSFISVLANYSNANISNPFFEMFFCIKKNFFDCSTFLHTIQLTIILAIKSVNKFWYHSSHFTVHGVTDFHIEDYCSMSPQHSLCHIGTEGKSYTGNANQVGHMNIHLIKQCNVNIHSLKQHNY